MASRHSTSSSQKLFACTNCHKRCKFEDLSPNQQLCKLCRKQFPSLNCYYCKLEYHPIKNSENSGKPGKPACEHCTRDLKQHGRPSSCSVCTLQSAFTGKKCSRCLHSEKKYGPPSLCQHCNTRCAFPKPDDVKRKVDGKTLCLLCTIKYKKDQFKKRNGTSTTAVAHSATKRSHNHGTSEHKSNQMETVQGPSLKKLKLESATSDSVQSHSTLSTRDSQPLADLLASNHIIETDKLQNEISSLKKQLAQKDQALLEKDKQICQLRADASEKERDFRTKQQGQQRSHGDQVDQLKSEIRSLRTQLSKISQKKTTSSDKQSNSFASIASSLAATPNSVNN